MKFRKPDGTFVFSWSVIVVFSLLGILLVVGTCYVGWVLWSIPPSENLNEATEPLAVSDVWTVEGQFSVWIDAVSEISATEAQKREADIAETAGKRYFDVAFSFENMGFSGCKSGNQQTDYLSVQTAVLAREEDGKGVWPTTLNGYDSAPYQTAWQDGTEVFVTEGVKTTDNHILVELEESDSLEAFTVRFLVPVERLTAETSVRYEQDFVIPIPK